jgi:hypothetical protein
MQKELPRRGAARAARSDRRRKSTLRTGGLLLFLAAFAGISAHDLARSRDLLRARWITANLQTIGLGCRKFGRGVQHFHPKAELVDGRVTGVQVSYGVRPSGFVDCPGAYQPGLRDLYTTTGMALLQTGTEPENPQIKFDGHGIKIVLPSRHGGFVVAPETADLDTLRALSGKLDGFLAFVRVELAKRAAAEVEENTAAANRIRLGGE